MAPIPDNQSGNLVFAGRFDGTVKIGFDFSDAETSSTKPSRPKSRHSAGASLPPARTSLPAAAARRAKPAAKPRSRLEVMR